MATMPDHLLEDICSFFPSDRNIKLSMLRLDKLHPVVSGNKWFKLKYNLEAAQQLGCTQLITFGGPYSNHLIATAAAACGAGFASIGIVRGFHAEANLTPTLRSCIDYGMKLHFISRENYVRKSEPTFLNELEAQFGKSYIIPEGGDNDAGRKGVEEIASYIPDRATCVCLPIGTGTTFTGLRNALPENIQMMGFTAMKGGDYLKDEITTHLRQPQPANWQLNTNFAFNGFAKTTPELMQFMQLFYRSTHIPLDVVYTGKMMFGIAVLMAQNAFAKGEHIICIHTGGLQGNPDGLYD